MINADKKLFMDSLRTQEGLERQGDDLSKELMRLRVEAESFQTLNNWMSDPSVIEAMASKNGVSVEALTKKMTALYNLKETGIKDKRANAYRNLVALNVAYAKRTNGFVASGVRKEVEMYA